jgi:hypothetical protein
MRCDCGRPASDQPDRQIDKDAYDDVRRSEESGGDGKPEAPIDAVGHEQSRPTYDRDWDGDLPPSPE